MSYRKELIDLRGRERRAGVGARIVEIIAAAIASGELGPDAKLPPTRQLAKLAGVNHLTAARAYRQLAERGLVVSRVGSGTFVRPAAALEATEQGGAQAPAPSGGATAWQRYALPDEGEGLGEEILGEMLSQADRPDVIPLLIGHPSSALLPREELGELTAEVAAEEGARVYQYAALEGVPELREAIAAIEAPAQASGDEPGNIVVTTGAQQAITLAARATLRPGDVVACESPTYVGLLQALAAAGATVLPVPVDERGLDVEALEQLVTRREVKLLALQSRLQNPLGVDLSPERRARLLELARERGFFILEDGVYADLRFTGPDLPPLRADAPEHVIYASSLSKTTCPGMRCGWVAASGPVLDRIAREKAKADLHGPVLPQLVAARFLAGGGLGRQLERARAFYRAGAEALLPGLREALAGTDAAISEPRGGGHVWIDLGPGASERELYAEALRRGVSFLPGSAATVGRSPHAALRVSFCFLGHEELREGARRLGEAVRAVAGSRPARQAVPVT
jgi:2-aminoadipate transaminase